MPEERKWQLIDITIPQDHNMVSKENEKVNKYTSLAIAISTEYKVKTEIVPPVIGALGSVSKQLKTCVDVIGIPNIIGSAQISTITNTARILSFERCLESLRLGNRLNGIRSQNNLS